MSARKRKTGYIDDGASDGDGGTPGSMSSASTSNSARKMVKRGTMATKDKVENPDFERLKEHLHQMAITEIMESYDNNSNNNQTLPSYEQLAPGSHPQFVQTSHVSQYWDLRRARDMYNRPRGDVIVFGQDDIGQLGLVASIGEIKYDGMPPTVLKDLSGGKVIQVAAGGQHSVALTRGGSVYTWGNPDDGALGRPAETEAKQVTPTPVKNLIPSKLALSNHAIRSPSNEYRDAVAIDAGTSHTTILTISGNVYTCGLYTNGDGKDLRDERPSDYTQDDSVKNPGSVLGQNNEPVHVFQMPGRVRFVAAGGACNAAILEDDTLVTWGMGLNGELARSADMTTLRDKDGELNVGDEFYFDENRKIKEEVIKEHYFKPKHVLWSNQPQIKRVVTHVALGGTHILVAARAPNDALPRLYSSGAGAWGKLGHGDEKPRHALTLVEALKDVPIARVAAGMQHSLILHAKGDTIYACGHNGYKECGVSKEKEVKAVNAQAAQLTKDKVDGMVLVPTPVPLPIVERLDKIGRVVDIACGESHSMAITSGGALYTWGYGEYGQAGVDPISSNKDIEHPRLAHDWFDYTQTFAHQASGGSQHSIVLASRYHKAVERDVALPSPEKKK